MPLNLSVLHGLIKQKRILISGILTVGVVVLFMWLFLPRNSHLYPSAQQEIMMLADNVRNHYRVRPDYWGLNNESAVKNGLVPQNMVRGQKVIGVLGREIIIGQDAEGNVVMPGGRNFMLTLGNLNRAACLAMLSWPIRQDENPELIRVQLSTAEQTVGFEWGGTHTLPLSSETAAEYCKNRNTVSWVFE